MKIAMLGLKGIPYPAGIENFTEQVGWRLTAKGHDVTVYVRPYVEVGTTYRGIRIKRFPSINTKHLDAGSHTLLAAIDTMFSNVDIAHFHALGPSVFALLTRMRGIKTIAHVHGLDWQREKWGRAAQLCLRGSEYAATYFPHRTVVVSRALQQYFARMYHKHVDYVPSGVEAYQYRTPREIKKWGLDKDNYILFLARLVPEKGCHYLLQAYEAIDTPMKLVIAGDASHSESYVAALKRTTNAHIIFTGYVQGMALEELFSNAYFYVLPSELEGLPHALLQALSFGKCVLASDIPPNVEALGDCGLTFRNKDVRDLKSKMLFLLHHPDFVQAQKEQSQTRVRQHYVWDEVVNRLECIYSECLQAPEY